MSRPQDDRNQEATVYLGNLDERCSDGLIWELMLQAGPVVNVHLPKDRISMAHQGYGFCEFLTEEDAEYACKIMNQIKLWGKPIRVNKASSDKKQLDVGANLFIGNLDENVDERLLYDTFSAFGMMATTAKIARDPQTGKSKGYGFVSYTDFESSDAAIESMNGQFLMNKAIAVQYAFKKDGKGERHGTPAERLLAAQARKNNALPVAARPPPRRWGRSARARPCPASRARTKASSPARSRAPRPRRPPQASRRSRRSSRRGCRCRWGCRWGCRCKCRCRCRCLRRRVWGYGRYGGCAAGDGGMPPQGMQMGMPPPPPPPGVSVYNPQAGFAPPPPPGFMPQGMPGMMPPPMMGPGGMPPPPPQYMPQQM
ncbi:hypothetical protein C8Q80DRAFT_108134 [Daedaleopsis nitida]|nr:hypothetical protein C8Q80DRAFT_108134 [Daedaleopsis nitida]